MKQVSILTDSMCHIPEALCRELEIHVVPIPFVWEGRTYQDFEISPSEFYTRLRHGAPIPTTSGPTPGTFKAHFEEVCRGTRTVLAILHGSQFSSTVEAARLALELVPGAQITIYDSGAMAMALGFQVLAAARAALKGLELPAVLATLDRMRSACGMVFATPHIEYLKLGGRVSHLEGFVASALELVPIMELRGGPVEAIKRVRSRNNLQPRLLDLVGERLGERPIRLGVLHADAEAEAWKLAAAARRRFAPDELIISELTPALGLHGGPDALGLAYSSGV